MTSIRYWLAALVAAALFPSLAAAQSDGGVFGARVASVTYGPYVRLELGGAAPSLDNAYWLPPGSSDPRIDFDAQTLDDRIGFGALSYGYDWQTGFRAEMAFFGTGTTDFVAPCKSASDGSLCDTHADITSASVSSKGVMANVFYAPLEARGSHSILQPFVVAGLGVVRNEVGQWTRTKNPNNATYDQDTVRTFQGAGTNHVAWSAGIGASLQVTPPGKWPVIVELAWRYYDLGKASGGATPVTSGSQPRQPLTVDVTEQVVSLGVRVPLQRF